MIFSVCGASDRTRVMKLIEANSPQEAAEQYVADDPRYDASVAVLVSDPAGEISRWLVQDVSEPVFAATPLPLGGG